MRFRRSIILAALTMGLGALIWFRFFEKPENVDLRLECFAGTVRYCIARPDEAGELTLPEPTPYWSGKHGFDGNGLPIVTTANGQIFRNMSSVALVAFKRSTEPFRNRCQSFEMQAVTLAALRFLDESKSELPGGALVWRYNYATQINDVLLEAGWASAFSQAAIVQLHLLAYCKTGKPTYRTIAERAAEAFFLPVSKGGLRSEAADFVWFQEAPLPDKHNPFILNAHLYAIDTLLLMDEVVGDARYRSLALKGVASVRLALPVVDTGDWNRYDLRPPPRVAVRATSQSKAQWHEVKGPIGQEFDPADLLKTVPVNIPGLLEIASARPTEELLQALKAPEIGLRELRWGATAREYIPVHASLLRSVGVKVGSPDLVSVSDRWTNYFRDFSSESDRSDR